MRKRVKNQRLSMEKNLALANQGPEFLAAHGERGARTYNGGPGQRSQRGPAAESLVSGSGAKPPSEAERLFALSQPEESANLS